MTAALAMSSAVSAGGFIGNPDNVVIILETDTSQANYKQKSIINFCPVNNKKKFKGSCLFGAYSFPGVKGTTYEEPVDSGVYEYLAAWIKPKEKGLFAFANGNVGGTMIMGPGTHTQTAVLAGGTVAVITRPFTEWKGGYAAAVKRAKAVFKKQYGAKLAGKMKFVAFQQAPVNCIFKRAVMQFQIKQNRCTLE